MICGGEKRTEALELCVVCRVNFLKRLCEHISRVCKVEIHRNTNIPRIRAFSGSSKFLISKFVSRVSSVNVEPAG